MRAELFCLTLTLFAGCAGSKTLAPGDPIRPSSELGLGFLSIKPAVHTNLIVFVSEDLTQQVLLSNSAMGDTTLHAFEAPPGRYCLDSVRTGGLVFIFGQAFEKVPCFDVVSAEQRYFGRIELDERWRFRFTDHKQEDLRKLSADHPQAAPSIASFTLQPTAS